MSIILGVDPGKATGYAVYDSEAQKVLLAEIHNDGPLECVERLTDLFYWYTPDEKVYESFIPRWGQKFDLDGVYLIGAMEAFTEGWNVVKPSEHKAVVKDSVLNPLMKSTGIPIGAGHSRDALRLCLYVSAVRLREHSTLQLLTGGSND